ncbi:hypothetical protein ACOMHN_032167 [Nucella lapillus]
MQWRKSLYSQPQDLRNKQDFRAMDKSSCSTSREEQGFSCNGQKFSCSQPQDLRNKLDSRAVERNVFVLSTTRQEKQAESLCNGQVFMLNNDKT